MSWISAAASCARAPSAAPTPAGPPPTITMLRPMLLPELSHPLAANIDTATSARLDWNSGPHCGTPLFSASRAEIPAFAHPPNVSRPCHGEETDRQDRATQARAALVGHHRHAAAQGVLRGRGRHRDQRAGEAA